MALRQLTIDGQGYGWQVSHQHVAPSNGLPAADCRELFTAFLAGEKTSPLHLWFHNSPTTGAGYPSQGTVYVWGEWSCNLHRPAVAAALIRAAILAGWTPHVPRKPWNIDNGFAFIQQHLAPEFLEPLRPRQEP